MLLMSTGDKNYILDCVGGSCPGRQFPGRAVDRGAVVREPVVLGGSCPGGQMSVHQETHSLRQTSRMCTEPLYQMDLQFD